MSIGVFTKLLSTAFTTKYTLTKNIKGIAILIILSLVQCNPISA